MNNQSYGERRAYHALNNILDLPNSQLQDQTNGLFILTILVNNLLEELLRFFSISPSFDARVICNRRILLHCPKTNNFIAVIHKLVNEPFKREVGIIVLVDPTEKRPTPSSALIPFMFVVQG